MAQRALVFLLPIFLTVEMGCGSSVSSTAFEDDGGAADASDESSGDSGSVDDSSVTPDVDLPDGGAVDSAVTPDGDPPLDTDVPPPDTDVPPPDDGPADTGTLPDAATDTGGCTEATGKVFNGHCYFALMKRTYTANRDVCVSRGAHLVTINSAEEQAFVNTFGGTDDRWIGLTREMTSTTYKWITGEPLSYTHWAVGEPNLTGTCARLRSDGTWGDLDCGSSIGGICEREP